MLFYEELIKKIDGNIEAQGRERFFLEANKTLIWLGTGIPFFIIGLMELYISTLSETPSTKNMIFGIVLLFIGFRHIKMYFSYHIILDFNKNSLISKGINVSFSNIKSCTLKEQSLGKRNRLQTVLDIITKDKKQIIIPLMMTKKVKFLNLLKSKLGKSFVIKER